MNVIQQQNPEATPFPGIEHATWAGASDGLSQLSVWRQSMAAGAMTPPHHHDCDEVVLCLGGQGEVHINGKTHRVTANSTIVLPRGLPHQIVNTGDEPLETLGILGSTPVGTFLPDGSAVNLPWRT